MVGPSILPRAHMTPVPRVLGLLRAEGPDDVMVLVGGTIRRDDAAALKDMGVRAVFTPGAPVQEMIDVIRATATPS